MEENIMKKLIALSGLFILVLAFSGCSFQGAAFRVKLNHRRRKIKKIMKLFQNVNKKFTLFILKETAE